MTPQQWSEHKEELYANISSVEVAQAFRTHRRLWNTVTCEGRSNTYAGIWNSLIAMTSDADAGFNQLLGPDQKKASSVPSDKELVFLPLSSPNIHTPQNTRTLSEEPWLVRLSYRLRELWRNSSYMRLNLLMTRHPRNSVRGGGEGFFFREISGIRICFGKEASAEKYFSKIEIILRNYINRQMNESNIWFINSQQMPFFSNNSFYTDTSEG